MPTLPFHSRRYFAACLALASVLVAPMRADIELPSPPPPQPQPVTTKVYTGESVDIPLSGVSRSGGGMKFIIRRQPLAGKLSEIRMTGPNTAIVTYTHLSLSGAGTDRFRYAASSAGNGTSTPAEVTVNISERPAVFNAPARLDFPDTAVGETSRQSFEIRNDGGGFIEGQLAVPAPWKIVGGDGSYSLGAGGSMAMTIAFTPTAAQTFSAPAQFSHASGMELGLGGGGFNPVEVAPREIRLESDVRSEVRSGAFVLRNVSLDDRELRIIAPPELIVQNSIPVAAQSEVQVALHTSAGFLGGLDGKITIEGGGVSFDVPLRVMPAPPRLTVKPAMLDLGTFEVGRAGRAKITVHNVGGSVADLSVKAPEGIEIIALSAGETLEADASREFEIRLSRPLAGKYSDVISFEAEQSSARVTVNAVILPASSVAAAGAPSFKPAAAAKETAYNDIPPVMQVGVTRQTRTELDLEWKKTSPNVESYVLFMRTLATDAAGRVQLNFKPLDRVKVRFVRDYARATLAGLRPGESVTLCVVGMDSDGSASRPSPMFTFATQPKPVFRFPWLWLCVLVLGILAVLIVRDRKRRRAAADQEAAARIAQI